jgi:NAD(P)-dependent dehydrogenase (short-subunit alcohol dehydrogenase family)
MKEFKGKVAVITGAASGIGLGLAVRCAREGMKVVLADIEKNALEKAQADLDPFAPGAETLTVVTDVSDPEDVQALARQTRDRFGAVHLLCNNAGVAAGAALWESSDNDCQWVLGVNLMGVIHGIRAFVPMMIAGGEPGHIVNTASLTGVSTFHPCALYHLTKHGVVALSEQLFHDLRLRKTGIGVSVLCPGFVNTRIMDSERNRPGRFRDAGPPPETAPNEIETVFRKMVQEGMPAAQVADLVFKAILEDKLFIFTHPETRAHIRSRMEAMLGERNPMIPPLETDG